MFLGKLIKKPHRLHLRLIILVGLAAVMASLLVYGILLAALFKNFSDQDHRELDGRLLSFWAAWQYEGEAAILERVAAEARDYSGRPFLLVLDNAEKEMLIAVIPGGWEDFDLKDPSLLQLTPGSYMTIRAQSRPYALLLTGTILDNGSRLLVGLSTENRQFLLGIYRKNYPWALAALILAAIAVGLFSARRFLKPIIQLNQEIDRIIVTGEWQYRLDSSGSGDQLDGLMGRFNRLLDRIESVIVGMKDSLDAVAHDLRTPLTRLRIHAELVLTGTHQMNSEDFLAQVIEEIDQTNALLAALMSISEAEQGFLVSQKISCDLSVLAEEVCELYQFIAEDRGMTLVLDASHKAPLQGDPVQLRQILGNLVDNALKYGPPGGRIDLRCGADAGRSWAEIVDDGPGIPPSQRPRIFDRLYRGDSSRGSRGLGLGLSMVKALVETHEGEIQTTNQEGRGALFRVSFSSITKK